MKIISVIFPVNNPEIVNQDDLEAYQSESHYFELSYVDTHLRELKTAEDVAQIFPLVEKRIAAVGKAGVSAIIVYAFGDVCVAEGKKLVSVPIMGLGKVAIHMASLLCRNHYTVIPGQLSHNSFIKTMVEEDLSAKYIPASYSVELDPAQIKQDPLLLDKLVDVASREIAEKNIDTFTLGCGSFMGVAKKLQERLIKLHHKPIIVIDPIHAAFNLVKTLC